MAAEEKKQQPIVSDSRMLPLLFEAVHRAGMSLFQRVDWSNATLTHVSLGTATNRFDGVIEQIYPHSPIYYHPDDITMIGGAALVAIDARLWNFKKYRKESFKVLHEEVHRETTDMDLVWWPRRSDPSSNVLYTASSKSIFRFATVFAGLLEESMVIFLQEYQSHLKGVTSIQVNHIPNMAIGVHMIEVDFITNSGSLKVIELAIHDTASSQDHTIKGEPINLLQDMTQDPVYSYRPRYLKFEIKDTYARYVTKVYLPPIVQYVEQQLFAYINIRRKIAPRAKFPSFEKLNAIKHRLRYLLKVFAMFLLQPIASNDAIMASIFGKNRETTMALIRQIQRRLSEEEIELSEENTPQSMDEYRIFQSMKETSRQSLASTSFDGSDHRFTNVMQQLEEDKKEYEMAQEAALFSRASLQKNTLERYYAARAYMYAALEQLRERMNSQPSTEDGRALAVLYRYGVDEYSSKFDKINEIGRQFVNAYESAPDHPETIAALDHFVEAYHRAAREILAYMDRVSDQSTKNLIKNLERARSMPRPSHHTQSANRKGGSQRRYHRKTQRKR